MTAFGKMVCLRKNLLTFLLGQVSLLLIRVKALVSAAKKAVPGFPACPIKRCSKLRQFVRGFSVFTTYLVVPMGRAFGAASAGRLRLDDTGNFVRPARHISRTARRVHSNQTEATL